MAYTTDNDHFRWFAKRLEHALIPYGKMNDDERLMLQRTQMENLFNLEQEFKETLLSHAWGEGVYKAFVRRICEENGNILTARPFFRERQETCIGPISLALERRDHKILYKYNFNYQFVLFAIKAYRWSVNSRIRVLAKQIKKARQVIVEFNMPLAISQARIFWSKAPAKAPSTHLQYMDFVQISCDGLISAVDKFVLPDPAKYGSHKELMEAFRKFRPMMVQRQVGNLIEGYSETMIHFYPKDKRKLYRANKFLVRQQGVVDYEKMAEAVNRDADGCLVEASLRTTAAEISSLLSAGTSSIVVTESSSFDDEERENPLDRCSANESARPDIQAEQNEALSCLSSAMKSLSVIDRKILRLKGVSCATL